MEELTTLFVYTRWRQSHKWTVGEDGLVEYRGERIPPSEVPSRFIVDYPMFDVLRAEVCRRINTGEAVRYPYRWVDVERFV
jgi:hypothetical protein